VGTRQGRRQRGGQWCPAPHLKSVPPISRLALWSLHTAADKNIVYYNLNIEIGKDHHMSS